MCGGVSSCESFARDLARTNSNDTINANGRATSVPVDKNIQRLIDEGLDPRVGAAGAADVDVVNDCFS